MWLSVPDWQIAGGFALLASATFPIGALCGILSCNRHRKLNDELLSTFLAIGAGSLIFAVAVEVYAEGLDAIEYVHPGYPIRTAAYVVQILSAVAGALLYIWLERSVRNGSITARLARERSAHPSTSSREVEEASMTVNVTTSADRPGERGNDIPPRERGARDTNVKTETQTRACTVASSCERSSTHENEERERLFREVSEELHEDETYQREDRREAELEVDEERPESAEERPLKLPLDTEIDRETSNGEHRAAVAALVPSSIATPTKEMMIGWRLLGEVLLFFQGCAVVLKSKYFRLLLSRNSRHTDGNRHVATEDDLEERETLQRRRQSYSNGQRETDQLDDNVRSADNLNLALVLWSSQLLDAVPEAMMIGFRTAGDTLSWAFIIALCISNFPESFCGGYLMRKEGISTCRTLLFWCSVSCITAVVSLCTVRLTPSHKSSVLRLFDAAVQGIAAGAMLALATASMLPAAYEARGVTSGLYCVVGFLLSLSTRLLFGLLNGPAPMGEEGGTVIHAAHITTSVESVMGEDAA